MHVNPNWNHVCIQIHKHISQNQTIWHSLFKSKCLPVENYKLKQRVLFIAIECVTSTSQSIPSRYLATLNVQVVFTIGVPHFWSGINAMQNDVVVFSSPSYSHSDIIRKSNRSCVYVLHFGGSFYCLLGLDVYGFWNTNRICNEWESGLSVSKCNVILCSFHVFEKDVLNSFNTKYSYLIIYTCIISARAIPSCF